LTEEEEEEANMSSSRSFVVIPGSRALDTRQFTELMVTIKACEGRREFQIFCSLVLAISFFFFDARKRNSKGNRCHK